MHDQTNNLREQYLIGMSHVANTVSVLTTNGPSGRAGVTVSAMSSVSADTTKPTLLVCVHQDNPITELIESNGVFCVNVLRDDQINIADTFAGRRKNSLLDKFDCTDWEPMTTGSPRIRDAYVSFDCAVLSNLTVGTHEVIFGEVQEVKIVPSGEPLVYLHRSYVSPMQFEKENAN